MDRRLLSGFLILISVLCSLAACSKEKEHFEYVVLLGEDSSEIEEFPEADILVIDGEYFSAEDLTYLREKGVKKIYSYLNIGSLENFRKYYDTFLEDTLGTYDNWPEERWIDVSEKEWQDFMIARAGELEQKGFDGFFVDNTDVYDQYPGEEIYEGICRILMELQYLDKDVIINGGDVFVTRYIESGEECGHIFDGVNQEEVYTSYDFEKNKCGISTKEVRAYMKDYLELVSENGYEVYTLEYATDAGVKRAAKEYAAENGWICYVADRIEL